MPLWDRTCSRFHFAPLVESALPLLKEGFQFIVDVVTSAYDIMKTVYEIALPALEAGFTALKSIVDAVNAVDLSTTIQFLEKHLKGVISLGERADDAYKTLLKEMKPTKRLHTDKLFNLKTLIEFRHTMHMYPEIAFKEFKT